MKQYKHKTGKIFTQAENLYYFYNETECVPHYVIENSNDWQEIKEYPKIVAFRTKDKHGKIVHINSDNTFGSAFYTLDTMLHNELSVESGDFEIYQVAKNEQEVFTVGDKVKRTDSDYTWVIDKFAVINDKIKAIQKITKAGYVMENIMDLIKTSDALFTTEDGKEIVENDKVYYTYKTNFNVIGSIDCFKPYMLQEYDKIWFSSKEAAEKWIDDNKPVFSKKQIALAVKIDLMPDNVWRMDYEYFKQKLGI